jgi:hypothetical protein
MRTSNNANRLADLEQIDRARVADGYLFATNAIDASISVSRLGIACIG